MTKLHQHQRQLCSPLLLFFSWVKVYVYTNLVCAFLSLCIRVDHEMICGFCLRSFRWADKAEDQYLQNRCDFQMFSMVITAYVCVCAHARVTAQWYLVSEGVTGRTRRVRGVLRSRYLRYHGWSATGVGSGFARPRLLLEVQTRSTKPPQTISRAAHPSLSRGRSGLS